MADKALARLQFATWLKNTNPELFQRAVAAANASTMGGLGEESSGFWGKFVDTVTGLGTTYLTLKNQKDAMAINLERAKQGQPPIDIATTAPVVRTQVDVSPELAQKLVASAGSGLNKTLLLVGGGVLAFLLLKKFL